MRQFLAVPGAATVLMVAVLAAPATAGPLEEDPSVSSDGLSSQLSSRTMGDHAEAYVEYEDSAMLDLAAPGKMLGMASAAPAVPARPALVLKDNQPGATFYAPITWMVAEGITVGYTDRTFRPRRPITRGEVAALLYRYYDPEFTAPQVSPFPDLSPDAKHYKAITWMKSEGLVGGYPNAKFHKDSYITRGEAAVILDRMNPDDDSFRTPTGPTFKDIDGRMSATYHSIYWVHWAGLANGYADGTFRPKAPISRGEFAKMLHRYELKFGR